MQVSTRRGLLYAALSFVVVLGLVALVSWLSSGQQPPQAATAGTTTTRPPITTTTELTTTTTMATTTSTQGEPTVNDLIGEYRGTVIRKDEPGTPDTSHVVSVEIYEEDSSVVGRIIHGPVGAPSIDSHGNVIMPLELELDGLELAMRWNETVGAIEDTTFAQCDWKAWEMNVTIEDGGGLLQLVDGYVEGQLPPNADASEWYLGCPAEERAIVRMTLVRR